jgi:ribulose-phosphate 3-epimerase
VPEIKVHPALMAADCGYLAAAAETVADAGAEAVHIDIADGRFAPYFTFGAAAIAQLRSHCPAALDVHLMVEEPERFVRDVADAGADAIAFNIEAAARPLHILRTVKELGCRAGVAVSPATSEDALEYVLDQIDYVIVLTEDPGYAERGFLSGMMRKVQNLRAMLGERDLAVEGGIDSHTAAACIEAGANVLIPGDYVFGHVSCVEAIASLRHAGDPA